jgi:hypothetical protein
MDLQETLLEKIVRMMPISGEIPEISMDLRGQSCIQLIERSFVSLLILLHEMLKRHATIIVLSVVVRHVTFFSDRGPFGIGRGCIRWIRGRHDASASRTAKKLRPGSNQE